jgi:lycopene cyclase domain-containing protein
MENRYTYLFLNAATIAGPLFLSFDKKVAFYKNIPHFIKSMMIASGIYLIWDILFTKYQVWQFNTEFLINKFIYNLPIEEYIFFLVVPYACLFIYECLKVYFPKIDVRADYIWIGITILSILMSIFFYQRIYTLITFGLTALTILALYKYESVLFTRIKIHLILAWIIALIPMAYVNGVLTSKPVLIYNNLNNCNFRIGTIPFEDFFYNLLLMIWMIYLYEKFKTKANTKTII